MFYKKAAILVSLGICSVILGFLLGSLDIFGFFDTRSQLNISILTFSIILTYIIAVCVFLLDFSDRNHIMKSFFVTSLLFAIAFYIAHSHVLLSIVLVFLFFALLYYIEDRSLFRSTLFIRFSANDIFLPVVKTSFSMLIVALALISFVQTKNLLTSSNLLTPQFVRVIVKPFIPLINKQLATQINTRLDPVIAQSNGQISRKNAITLILSETITRFDEEKTMQYIGVAPKDIPIHKAIIQESGTIDLSPVVEDMLPAIADTYNSRLGQYAAFGPFIIAIIAFLLLQSLLWPIGIIAGLVTPAIFYVLLKTKFIVKKLEKVDAERISL